MAVVAAPVVEANDDQPVVARRVGSPFAESASVPGAADISPENPATRWPVVRPNYPRYAASSGGAIAALVLGAASLAISFFTPLAVITAVLCLALGVWGLHSTNRGTAIVGLLLGCLAVAVGGFNGVTRLYEMQYGHSPWETPLDEVPVEQTPTTDQI
jgi:hypothetical protein